MKKNILVISICCILFIPLVPLQAQPYNKDSYPSDGTHWPMFRYNPEHLGYTSAQGPQTNRTLWTYTTGGAVRSSAAIYTNRVYVGSYDGKLYCFHIDTGEKMWETLISTLAIFSSPAVAFGSVYIGAFDNVVYSLNAETGAIQWSFPTDGPVVSSPCIAEGYLYVGSSDDYLYCFDADPSDGIDEGSADPVGSSYDLIWRIKTGDDVRSSPAVAQNKVYVGSFDGNVYCVNAITGALVWNVSLTDDWIFGSPSVFDTKVYVGTYDGNLSCLDAYTGSELWRLKINTKEVISSSPAIADGKLYIGTVYSDTGRLYCIDIQTHLELWNYSTGPIKSSPAVSNGKVYVGSDDKYVYCFDAVNGTCIWSYLTNGLIWSSPSIADGKLVVGTDGKTLYVFEDEDTNSPPDVPQIISGPHAAGPRIPLTFTIVTDDPDGDQVYYKIDWGDGNISDWLGPFDQNMPITINHTWYEQGDYALKLTAKDTYSDEESGWSDAYQLSIAPQLDISNIKSGFIYLRLESCNKSYAYIYLLDTLGASVVISNDLLRVQLTATDVVQSVKFVAYNPLWDENLTLFDNTSSDGFFQDLEIPSGLWELTTYAYDSNGNLIDAATVDYVIFIIVNAASQQVRQSVNTFMKQRVHRLLHR
ncbi:MAG: PQQ-binding-like beta-propeller repeat protein [Candidatus Thermoplasmatota archaeon]